MKKRILSVIGIVAFSMSAFIGCANEATSDNTVADENISKQTQIANPWIEADADAVYNLIGIDFGIPDGAQNTSYQVDEGDGIAEMDCDMSDSGIEICARMEKTDDFQDISGLYYNWESEADCTISNTSEGKIYSVKDGDNTILLCTWYDADAGISYSVMAEGTSGMEEFDIQGISEAVFSHVVAPIVTDMSSFDSIISQLSSGQAYAFADMDPDHDVLLVSNYGCYDNGDGNMASFEATIFGYDKDGNIINYGEISGDGTAYPLAVYDGCLICANNHSVEIEYVDESTSSLVVKEAASVDYTESGDETYYYKSADDSTENVVEDDTKLQEMYDKFSGAIVINFTEVQ